jgi:glycosyltransferase 2 family protein
LKKFKIVKLVLSIIFSLYLIWVFINYLNYDFNQFPNILSSVPIYIFILIFIVNLLVNLIRSVRYKILLQSDVGLIQMFGIVNTWQFYNSMLPYRTGELSYIYLLKKKENISLSESTASLFVSRMFDLLVFLFCCSFSLLLTSADLKANIYDIYTMSIILFLLTGIGFLILFKIKTGFKIVILILYKTNMVKYKFVRRIVSFLENVIHNLYCIHFNRKVIVIFLLTIMSTLLLNLNTYLLIIYFNVDLNFLKIFVASSLTFLTIFLPIQGIANIGTFEGSFIIGLLLFGIDRNIGLNAAFALHIIFYIILFITFILISLFYRFKKYISIQKKLTQKPG